MNPWIYWGGLALIAGYMAFKHFGKGKIDPSLRDRKDPRKHWMQAAMALYRGDVPDAGYWAPGEARNILTSTWSVDGRDKLVALIERYMHGECNVGFDKLRIIWLARLGRGAGWLDDDTSWAYVFRAIESLQRTYDAWPALAEAMRAGREQWYGGPGKIPAGTREQSDRAHAHFAKEYLTRVPYR